MLPIRRSKPNTPQIIFSVLIVIYISALSSGCQSIDHKSPDQATTDQTRLIEQDHLNDRIAELVRREEALIAREIAVSSRESEVVTVLAEVMKQKEQLEHQQQQLMDRTSTTDSPPKSPAATQTSKTITRNPQHQTNNTSTANTAQAGGVKDKRKILGGLEYIYLDPPGIILSARIDTGAQTSSLNALDMVEFERDGKPYVKFNIVDPNTGEKIELTRRIRGHTKIKKHITESQRRPIVSLRVKLGELDEHISFTLIDRSKFKQQALIGRNFLRDLAVVDVSKEYTIPKTYSKQP
ncbi:MAG: RimK/LysX family protein [Nitrosomonas sp.]|nr:RimK/LysX family protein [Nitrosomonas sp.]